MDGVEVAGDPVELPAVTLRLGTFDEAVVVTATRIEEPLQQVPMSISAVTGADIELRAIDNLTELSRWTPGLTVVDQGARGSNVVIARGLHTDALNGSEAAGNNYNNAVATYLGDIPLAVDLRLHDIERGGGAAGTAGHAVRRGHPGRRRPLPAAAPRHRASHAGGPRRPLRPRARRRPRRRRRPDLQRAPRDAEAGAARLRRPLRESRLHRLRLPAAHPGRLRARAGPERSRRGGRQPALGAGREHGGYAVRAHLPVVGGHPQPVSPPRLSPAGSAGRCAADQPRAVVRHRPLCLRAPLSGAERPEERAPEPRVDLGDWEPRS